MSLGVGKVCLKKRPNRRGTARATARSLTDLAKMSAHSRGDDIDEDTKQRLVESIEIGDEARVVEILDRVGWNVLHSLRVFYPFWFLGQQEKGTLLHVACWYRQSKLVKLFLEKNANPDEKSTDHRFCPLHLSAECGDEESCALLISSGCTVDAVDVSGWTPLMVASVFGNDHVVKLLIKNHADVNHGDHGGDTPLHFASYCGKNSTVQLLVDSGADIDCLNNSGHTPLHDACKKGETKTVKLLVSLGADATFNRNPDALYTTVNGGYLETARVLISNLPKPASVSEMLRVNLRKALEERSLELLSFVCAHGALDAADDEMKMEAEKLAMESISQDSSPTLLSPSLDSASLQDAFQRAMEKGTVHAAIILASVGALNRVTDDVVVKAMRLALSEGSVELALVLLKSSSFRMNEVNDMDLSGHILRLALEERSLELLSFVCAHGALDAADGKVKMEAAKLGIESISHDSSPTLLSQSIDSVSLQDAFQRATEKGAFHAAIILASVSALRGVTDVVVTNVLRLALSEGSVEFAWAVLKFGAFKTDDKKFFNDLLDFAMRKESIQLVLAMCHTVCASPNDSEQASLSQDEVLDLVLKKEPSAELVAGVCKDVLDAVGAETANNVLLFALEKKSVDLALIVCEASTLTKETVPSPTLDLLVQLMLSTLANEPPQPVSSEERAQNAEKQQMASDMLQLGLKFDSVELVLAVVSEATALASLTRAMLPRLLQFALHHRSAELAVVVCKTGALDGAGTRTVNDVLALALETRSVELVLIAFQAEGVLADERAPDLIQATADMAMDFSSVQLAIVLCQNEEFSRSSAPTVRKMLQLGLDFDDVVLVLAVVSNAASPASALSETLVTLLQFAVKHRSLQLAILVCNAGAITKADNQLLNSALEMAIDVSSNELLSLLSSAGVLQRSSDKVKEKALRQAAITGDLQLADHCISSGVLNGADHWGAPTAIEIATQRGHSRLAVKLSKALDNHKLLSLGQTDANTVLIRVVGSPGAGKSTLVKSLRTSRLRGFFRWESQFDEDDKNFRTRTRGIQVESYEDSNGTLYRILDLGGQEDFASANQLFIGEGQIPIINIVTISALKSYLEMKEEVLQWSAFFASRKDNQAAVQEPALQPVIVAATRSEKAAQPQEDNVREAVHQAGITFGMFLDFQHGPVFVDARKSWGRGMGELRCMLADVSKDILKRAPPQAALCNDIQRALPRIRANAKRPVISRQDLPGLVAQGLSSWWQSFDESVIQSHADLLAAALRQMSDACEILSFNTPGLQDVLIIDPPWLLRDVIGALLSPDKFPPPRVRYDKNGRATRKRVEAALKANFGSLLDHGKTLHMVAEIGLCILDVDQQRTGDDEGVLVPSKMNLSRNLHAVLLPRDLIAIWFGIELLCSEVPLSVCLFPQLQVYLHNYLLQHCKQKPIMWSGGLAVALCHEHVVGIVEARRSRMVIDIIVQGTEATRRTCFCLLQVLKEQTLLKAQQFSPGSDITERILSSRELSSLDWSKSDSVPRITYDRKYAEEAIEHGNIRPQHDDPSLCVLEDALNLMAIPSTHVSLMTADGYESFCHEINCSPPSSEKAPKWQELAQCLRMPPPKQPPVDSARSTDPTHVILQWWSRRSAQNTIERLLAVVKGMNHLKAATILQKELKYSLNVLPGKPEPVPELKFGGESPDHSEDDGISPGVPPSAIIQGQSSLDAPVDNHSSLPTPERDLLPDPVQPVMDDSGSSTAPVQEHISLPALPSSAKNHGPTSASLTENRDRSSVSAQEDSLPPTHVTKRSPPSAVVREHQLAPSAPASAAVMDDCTSPALEHSGTGHWSMLSPIPCHVAEPKDDPCPASVTEGEPRPPMPLAAVAVEQSVPSFSTLPASEHVGEHTGSELFPAHAMAPLGSTVDHSPQLDADSNAVQLGRPALESGKQCPDQFAVEAEDFPATTGEAQSNETAHSNVALREKAAQVNQEHRSVREEAHEAFALTDTRLVEVANMFHNSFECKQLAVYLQISQGGRIVSALRDINPRNPPRDMAFEIMMTWKREKGSEATSDELQRVLRYKMKKVDVVEHVWPAAAAMVTSDANLPVKTSLREDHSETEQHTHSLVDKVPEMAIMDIVLSSEFPEDFSCEHLAVFLDISKGSEFAVDSSPRASNREKAYDVMMEWKKEKGSAATGERLYNVLHNDLKMKGLATQLRKALRLSTLSA